MKQQPLENHDSSSHWKTILALKYKTNTTTDLVKQKLVKTPTDSKAESQRYSSLSDTAASRKPY